MEITFPLYGLLSSDCTNPYVKEIDGKLTLVLFTEKSALVKLRGTELDRKLPVLIFDSWKILGHYLKSLSSKVSGVLIDGQ